MDKWYYRISVGLAILGLLVSIYMTIYKLTNNESMCIGNGGCSVVNNSVYAEVDGIPVAVIGMIGYGALLAVLFLESKGGYFADNGPILFFGMALTGFLFTLWLIYVEIVLIKALCPFCLTSQISMTIIFILSIIRLVRQPQN